MVITREITVDVSKRNTFSAIVAKQHDSNSRFLKVTLTDLGEVITVPTTAQVVINALRDDGESKSFLGTANADGTVTVPLTPWMLELDGDVKCDVSIVDSEERKLTSTLFILAVEEATYSGDDITDDENYDLLIALLAEVSDAKTAEAGRVQAENARVTAESGRSTAETTRQSNETARAKAETARAKAETDRATAEKQRADAETARKTAEELRVAAESKRQTDTQTAIQNANAARDAANAAAAEIGLENRDNGKNYTYKFFVQDGYPGIELTEIPE